MYFLPPLLSGMTAGGMGGTMGSAVAASALPPLGMSAPFTLSGVGSMVAPQLSMLTNPTMTGALGSTAGQIGMGLGGLPGATGIGAAVSSAGGLISPGMIAGVAQMAQLGQSRAPVAQARMGSLPGYRPPQTPNYYTPPQRAQQGPPQYQLGHSNYWRRF